MGTVYLIRRILIFCTFAANQARKLMTNQQFKDYIEQRRKAIDDELNGSEQLSATAIAQLKEQGKMLESAWKIMTYGTGPERRRFRRYYERRLAK